MAVGLAVVLIDLPYDIMGVKMLWWTWHDTDPNIYDRHYWVPWTSYYFHAAFAAGFTFLFHGTRRLLSSTHKFQADNFIIELVCSLVTGMFGMALGVLQFLPLYHPLHDNFKIHTEVCVLIFLGAYALLVWAADRNPSKEARPSGKRGWFDVLCLIPLVHYAFFFLLSIYGQPEKMKSTGLHEPIGDCSAISPVYTAFGQVLSKRTFLCASDFDEQYFNFECLNEVPPNASDWYTVCGTPFPNHVEYMIVVGAECIMGLFIYFNMLYRGGAQPGPPKITLKSKSKGKRE
ncbi:hypothetical protein CAPTEDRAFT_169444 [Capitella teleta]|uniref:DUF7802 domain-containing protein n=1 Tax=Capitella teleta TaxID=283909 RepID=R7TS47_CAPTE|nr:hypothetical protein CAPTEDRAFT_169444 [Capitella teleta]|eukprot:ELT96479.1 hypothetical protein CAPTEDRAFT_169444 [Capitella teleta]